MSSRVWRCLTNKNKHTHEKKTSDSVMLKQSMGCDARRVRGRVISIRFGNREKLYRIFD